MDSMMGLWFAGKSPHFDQIQRENIALVDRVAAAADKEGEEGGGQLGEEWSTPTGESWTWLLNELSSADA